MSALSKMTFSGTNLILNFVDGTTEAISESTIQKMLFTTVSAIQNTKAEGELLTIYPNPASGFISFSNAPEGELNVLIYRMDGALIFSTKLATASEQLNVSSLTKGLYLIKVNNHVLKFSKI